MSRSMRPRGNRTLAIIALLGVGGTGVSGYLWATKAGLLGLVCGPLGDCLTVNASPYSEVFGLPVASLGALAYLALVGLAVAAYFRPGALAFPLTAYTLAVAGATFSLYLTGVEAFVLDAYCIWCLISWGMVSTLAVLWGFYLLRVPSLQTVGRKRSRQARRNMNRKK